MVLPLSSCTSEKRLESEGENFPPKTEDLDRSLLFRKHDLAYVTYEILKFS